MRSKITLAFVVAALAATACSKSNNPSTADSLALVGASTCQRSVDSISALERSGSVTTTTTTTTRRAGANTAPARSTPRTSSSTSNAPASNAGTTTTSTQAQQT